MLEPSIIGIGIVIYSRSRGSTGTEISMMSPNGTWSALFTSTERDERTHRMSRKPATAPAHSHHPQNPSRRRSSCLWVDRALEEVNPYRSGAQAIRTRRACFHRRCFWCLCRLHSCMTSSFTRNWTFPGHSSIGQGREIKR